jgi:serine/threonine protein kinase
MVRILYKSEYKQLRNGKILIILIQIDSSISQICKEIELLTKVDHINIIKIYEYYMYTSDIFIVMEYVSGGELFDQIANGVQNLTIDYVKNVMIQLLSAISYMHHHKIGKSGNFVKLISSSL